MSGADVYNATLATSLDHHPGERALGAASSRAGSPACRGRAGRGARAPARAAHEHVVLCGFGRVGSAIGEALQTFGVPYVVIERDPDIVKRPAHARGCRACSVTRPAGASSGGGCARGLARRSSPLPEIDRARLVVRHVREMNEHVPILARAHDPADGEGLARAGASEVIHPELEAAATLIRHALKRLALPQERVLAISIRFRGAMELAARERAAGSEHAAAGGRGRAGAGDARRPVAERGAHPRAAPGSPSSRSRAAAATWS